MKEFLLLIRENVNYGSLSLQEMQDEIEKHLNWVEQLMEQGCFKGGNPLDSQGVSLKGKDRVLTDGPFVESKECISGFYFLMANSLEEATEIGKGCPALDFGASIEIREVFQTEDESED
ncbi:YciI family protein [Flavobacterium sp. JP2137]|uniref:YciI family protein n=1 Tax=Flavobacterium sp. JP2137 TaxID=3414510 RepID=UPI003D2FD818